MSGLGCLCVRDYHQGFMEVSGHQRRAHGCLEKAAHFAARGKCRQANRLHDYLTATWNSIGTLGGRCLQHS